MHVFAHAARPARFSLLPAPLPRSHKDCWIGVSRRGCHGRALVQQRGHCERGCARAHGFSPAQFLFQPGYNCYPMQSRGVIPVSRLAAAGWRHSTPRRLRSHAARAAPRQSSGTPPVVRTLPATLRTIVGGSIACGAARAGGGGAWARAMAMATAATHGAPRAPHASSHDAEDHPHTGDDRAEYEDPRDLVADAALKHVGELGCVARARRCRLRLTRCVVPSRAGCGAAGGERKRWLQELVMLGAVQSLAPLSPLDDD